MIILKFIMYLVFLREILAAKILPEMEFYKMNSSRIVPKALEIA